MTLRSRRRGTRRHRARWQSIATSIAGFVAQYQADASSAPQNNPTLFGWEQEDRMPPSQGSLLKLRRPVHRTFHVVAWEACCKMPTAPSGQPAVAPEKIAAAGFVVRTGDANAPQGFQIVQGKPQRLEHDRARGRSRCGAPGEGARTGAATGDAQSRLYRRRNVSAASARGAGRRDAAHVAVRLSADRRRRLRAADTGDATGAGPQRHCSR